MPLPSRAALLREHRAGLSLSDLGRRYGVSRQRIHQVLGKAEFKPRSVGPAKLTASKVREARRLRSKGWAFERLGERYGVAHITVYNAVTGRTWAHVDEPIPGEVRTTRAGSKLSVARVREARRLRERGWSYSRLAERYGVFFTTIREAVSGRTWGWVE